VSLKLTTGKTLVRRFLKSASVRVLYALALASSTATTEALEGQEFDIFTSYPPKSLKESMELTLSVAGVAGSQVIMRWV
jgi:hypothetical protein